jgi:hypothetical protein
LREIQLELLDGETVLLEYSLGESTSYLWVVSKTGYTSHVLPPGPEIEAEARQVYELLTTREPSPLESMREYRRRIEEADSRYWERAARLSDMLLGPVAEALDGKRLLIVSDGALLYLPFGALPAPRSSLTGGPWIPILEEHEVTWLP